MKANKILYIAETIGVVSLGSTQRILDFPLSNPVEEIHFVNTDHGAICWVGKIEVYWGEEDYNADIHVSCELQSHLKEGWGFDLEKFVEDITTCNDDTFSAFKNSLDVYVSFLAKLEMPALE